MKRTIQTVLHYECGICGKSFRTDLVDGVPPEPPAQLFTEVNTCRDHPGQAFAIQTLTRALPEPEGDNA